MEVIPYNPSLKSSWDFVLNNSINGIFLFRREFFEYHKDRFQDASLLFFDQGEPVAIFPCNRFEDQIYSHQGLSFGGIILLQGFAQSKILNSIEVLVQYLEGKGFRKIEIKPIPDFYSLLSQDFLLENLATRGFVSNYNYDTYVIDLSNSPKVRTGRWKLRESHRRNYEIREVSDFSEFWNLILYPLYQDRIGVPPTHTLKEIQELKSRNRSFINQFSIYDSEDRILAGITVFEYERVAKFQYIAATKEGKRLRALDILMEHLIQEKFKNKAYIDLGTVHDPVTGLAKKGLIEWKLSWHAKPCPLYKLQLESEN